jgi:hypothetical protein
LLLFVLPAYDCLISCDCTDFRIPEYGKKFYSYKYRKSGLRYEVGLCILTGDIVWINGPYECGVWNDVSIFRNSLLSHLAANERVEADDGYVGEHPRYIKCPRGIVATPALLSSCNKEFGIDRSPSMRDSRTGLA